MFFILRLSFILKLSVISYTVHAVPLKQDKCGASFQDSIKEKVELEIIHRGVEDFIKEYGGQKGCVQLSKKLKAKMSYIYKLVSLSLKKGQMSRLNWQLFNGRPEDFSELSGRLFNDNGKLNREHIGMKGYTALADQLYKGDMHKTYINVSAVLDKGEMKRLGWKLFQGATDDFFKLRKELLNDKGELKKEHESVKGYTDLADQLYQGNMHKTYINVSTVLDRGEMKRLEWRMFHGTTDDFFELRDELFNENIKLKKKYIGMEGYAKFADQYYKGDMQKTFANVSAALGGAKSMKELGLGWKLFQGATDDFFELREKLFNENGKLREESIGMEGYADLAERLYQGDMLKTFANVSAALGGAESMKELGLGWKQFQGAADQYRELKKLFAAKSIEELGGIKGQEYAAEAIFEKDTRRTYRNVSNLREELLGSREAFEQLNWREKLTSSFL